MQDQGGTRRHIRDRHQRHPGHQAGVQAPYEECGPVARQPVTLGSGGSRQRRGDVLPLRSYE